MQQVDKADKKAQKLMDPVWDVSTEVMGFVPNSMRTMARDPKLLFGFSMMSMSAFNVPRKRLFRLGKLIPMLRIVKEAFFNEKEILNLELRSLIAFASSISSGCMYCQAHMGSTSSRYGASQEKLDDILNFEDSELYSEAEKAAVSVAFAAGKTPNEVTDDHFVRLRKYFDEREIVNIVGVIAYFGFLNRWNDTMGTQLEKETRAFGQQSLGGIDWEIGKHDAAYSSNS